MKKVTFRKTKILALFLTTIMITLAMFSYSFASTTDNKASDPKTTNVYDEAIRRCTEFITTGKNELTWRLAPGNYSIEISDNKCIIKLNSK